MIATKLTMPGKTATDRPCKRRGEVKMRSGKVMVAAMLLAGMSATSGCINVAAPEEPIVIELNINIRQEVIYRLAEDAANTIEENPDIF
jgi:hypothetical protein